MQLIVNVHQHERTEYYYRDQEGAATAAHWFTSHESGPIRRELLIVPGPAIVSDAAGPGTRILSFDLTDWVVLEIYQEE